MIRKEAAPKAASLFLIQWWLFADPTGRSRIVLCMKVDCVDELYVEGNN